MAIIGARGCGWFRCRREIAFKVGVKDFIEDTWGVTMGN